MKATRFVGTIVAILLLGSIAHADTINANPKKCARCGVESCCLKKCCRPVPIEIDKKEVCYDCKCEDFCVPGRSIKCETKWHKDDCGCWVENVWKPTCAGVRTRNVMVRKEVTRKTQSSRWEVQHLCAACSCLPPESKSAPGGGGEGEEEVDAMEPEDQSVEEVEISTLPQSTPSVMQASQPAPAQRRSLWSFFR